MLLARKTGKNKNILQTLRGLKMTLRKLILMVQLLMLLLPLGCYREKLIEIKYPRPNPPELKQILIDTNVDCNTDKKMCDIIFNVSKLLEFICKLEAQPGWDMGETFCNLEGL